MRFTIGLALGVTVMILGRRYLPALLWALFTRG